jgi:hypothetical protein
MKGRTKVQIPKISFEEGEASGAGIIKVCVIFLVIAALIYSEIMFLSIISIAFPSGLIGGLAVVGALVTGGSFIALYFGKTHWFVDKTPQFYAAVAFTAVEILVMASNDVVAYMLVRHEPLGYLAVWENITPASPLIAIVGWIIITYLDPGNKIKQMRMKAEQQEKSLNIQYEMIEVKTRHELRLNHLQQTVTRLDDAMAAPSVQAQIDTFANRMVAKVLTQATGINAFSPPPSDKKAINAPASFAQTTQVEPTVTMTQSQLEQLIAQLGTKLDPMAAPSDRPAKES